MSEFVNTRTTLGDQATLDGVIDRTLTELKEKDAKILGDKALYKNTGLTLVAFPGVTSAGQYSLAECSALQNASFDVLQTTGNYMFQNDRALTTISFPALQTVGSYSFQNCSALASISLPNAKTINSYAFDGCTSVASVSIPEATSVQNYAFRNVPVGTLALPKTTSLGSYIVGENGPAEVDMSAKPSSIPTNAFNSGSNLTSLVIRSDTLIPLSGTNAFNFTPIQAGFGWIYVPADLVASYKSASNWSTYASQIVSLANYPLEVSGTITDTWAQIFAAEDDGTYSTKYSVGDTKFVKVSGVPVCMQIAAFDADDKADNSGKAKITWLCKGYQGKLPMNPTNTTQGGWASCAMRQYLINNVYANIESAVKNRIVQVSKTYYDYGTNSTLASSDNIWIPSYREVGYGTNIESSGVIYSGLFTDNTSRIKYASCTTAYAYNLWLRSPNGGTNFFAVNSNGSRNYSKASDSCGVVFGFCT